MTGKMLRENQWYEYEVLKYMPKSLYQTLTLIPLVGFLLLELKQNWLKSMNSRVQRLWLRKMTSEIWRLRCIMYVILYETFKGVELWQLELTRTTHWLWRYRCKLKLCLSWALRPCPRNLSSLNLGFFSKWLDMLALQN